MQLGTGQPSEVSSHKTRLRADTPWGRGVLLWSCCWFCCLHEPCLPLPTDCGQCCQRHITGWHRSAGVLPVRTLTAALIPLPAARRPAGYLDMEQYEAFVKYSEERLGAAVHAKLQGVYDSARTSASARPVPGVDMESFIDIVREQVRGGQKGKMP